MELKRVLPRTWGPFFARHGRLSRIQQRAIPHVLAGEDVVIVSPAATGKTEAAVAPAAERLLTRGAGPLSLLYLSPTRALVNDLEIRLREPLRAVGLSLAVQTGDRPRLSRSRPEDCLITTPESLDSLLCRSPGPFSGVRIVVLDELHVLDNTCRGDQLIVLLNRLRRFHLESPAQSIAMSATLADPAGVAGRYVTSPVVVEDRERRGLVWHLAGDPAEAIAVMRREGLRKGLLFCNSRKDVETLSVSLAGTWPQDRILVHHGSLSRAEREEAERTFRLWEWGICISTTTLEFGVDIGDVDATLLFRPPPSPSSFLQRVGRSCRRQREMVAICISGGEDDEAIFRLLIGLASEGKTEPIDYRPDLSVAVQQTFSMLFGSPAGMRVDDLLDVLSPLAPPDRIERIFDHLMEGGYVEPAIRGRLRASMRLMDMGERGFIHSNIPDQREHRVVDIASGRTVGSLVLNASRGTTFLLSGRLWEVVEEGRGRVGVRMVRGPNRRAHFARRFQSGAFTRYLPADLLTP